jgi:transposase InsO family protein
MRHGLNRLPRNERKRSPVYQRYEKQVPGHHVQINVKFLDFQQTDGQKARRFQYTAIDDATRIRAPKIYEKHTQENAISFVDYVIGKFPFRIQTIRTDNGHEFHVKFHWHLLDLGMDHVYIKPRTPRLNGKVERSHSTDQQEFYQLLSYKDDVDLEAKLMEWETFYNCHRPHASLKGKTPYDILLEKLQSNPTSTEVISSTHHCRFRVTNRVSLEPLQASPEIQVVTLNPARTFFAGPVSPSWQ